MGFQLSYFKSWKMMLLKVLHSICQQIWKTQQWPQECKRSVFIPNQRRAVPKNVKTTIHLHSFLMLVKLYSKILQGRLQQYLKTKTFQVYKLDLEKADEPRSNCQDSLDHRQSKGIPEKKKTNKQLLLLH